MPKRAGLTPTEFLNRYLEDSMPVIFELRFEDHLTKLENIFRTGPSIPEHRRNNPARHGPKARGVTLGEWLRPNSNQANPMNGLSASEEIRRNFAAMFRKFPIKRSIIDAYLSVTRRGDAVVRRCVLALSGRKITWDQSPAYCSSKGLRGPHLP